jgi:hypothetical protein
MNHVRWELSGRGEGTTGEQVTDIREPVALCSEHPERMRGVVDATLDGDGRAARCSGTTLMISLSFIIDIIVELIIIIIITDPHHSSLQNVIIKV